VLREMGRRGIAFPPGELVRWQRKAIEREAQLLALAKRCPPPRIQYFPAIDEALPIAEAADDPDHIWRVAAGLSAGPPPRGLAQQKKPPLGKAATQRTQSQCRTFSAPSASLSFAGGAR
jgi:hypothetical protein